jgi:thiol-disulfide isomerase/thioredoxin
MNYRQIIFILFVLVTHVADAKKSAVFNDYATITVTMPATMAKDTLFLSLYAYGLANKSPDAILYSVPKNKVFTFHFKIPNAYQYFSIHQQFSVTGIPKYLLQNYIVEKNDSVAISFDERPYVTPTNLINYPYYSPIAEINKYDVVFEGRGCHKYQCRYVVDKMLLNKASAGINIIDSSGFFLRNHHPDQALQTVYPYLLASKQKLGNDIFHQLLTDVVSVLESERLYFYTFFPLNWQKKENFHKNVTSSYNAINTDKGKLTTHNSRLASPYYSFWQALYYKIVVSGFPDKSIYNENVVLPTILDVKKNFSGDLGDKIITSYVISCSRIITETIMDSVLDVVKTGFCVEALRKLKSANVGAYAKDFQLTDTRGNRVGLKDFTGKVVFIDFWFIGCGACIKYYKEVLKPVEKKYRNDSSVVFISININTNRTDWLKAIASDTYTSDKCINLNTGKLGQSHSVINDYDVRSYPSPYLIDKKGRIITSNNNELRFKGAERLVQLIEAAKS